MAEGERDPWIWDEDRRVWLSWPHCAIPSCPNRICIGRSDRFCWPHSSSGKTLDDLIEEAGPARELAHET